MIAHFVTAPFIRNSQNKGCLFAEEIGHHRVAGIVKCIQHTQVKQLKGIRTVLNTTLERYKVQDFEIMR